jgi:Zinc finger, C3HC4 type (RING finger)
MYCLLKLIQYNLVINKMNMNIRKLKCLDVGKQLALYKDLRIYLLLIMTKCGYCNVEGHNIRNCNHDGANMIRSRYRQVISESELDNLLGRYTSSMLSIVMVLYNARNLSLTKSQKMAFIKEKWLSGQAIPETEVERNVRIEAEVRHQERLREIDQFMIESQRIICEDNDIANIIYRDVCIEMYQFPRYIVPANNPVEREAMAQRLSTICNHIVVSIVMITNDNIRSHRIFENIMNLLNMPAYLIIRIRARLFFGIVQHREEPMQQQVALKIKTTLMPHIEDSECSICYDVKEQVELNCKHSFCVDCIDSIAKARKKSFICCALCREEVTEFNVHTEASKVRCERQIIANV